MEHNFTMKSSNWNYSISTYLSTMPQKFHGWWILLVKVILRVFTCRKILRVSWNGMYAPMKWNSHISPQRRSILILVLFFYGTQISNWFKSCKWRSVMLEIEFLLSRVRNLLREAAVINLNQLENLVKINLSTMFKLRLKIWFS